MLHGLACAEEEREDEGEVRAPRLLVHGAGVEAHGGWLFGVRRGGATEGIDVYHWQRGEEDLGEDRDGQDQVTD